MKGLYLPIFLGAYVHIILWSCCNAFQSTFIDKLGYAVGLRRYVYSVVIHGGSTGTRLYCYGFYTTRSYRSLKLDKISQWTYTPPLHEFANNPSQALNGLTDLVNKAKAEIPKSQWADTSIVLMATTGVLNLPRSKSTVLLTVLKQYLRTTGFRASYDCVTLLDGDDEGLLSWFSLNLLLDRLHAKEPQTVAIADMGGMTVSVGFVPRGNNVLPREQYRHLTGMRIYQHKFEVYSQGYSNYGLNEFRIKVLLAGGRTGSVCISPLIDTEWVYNNIRYNIRGVRRANQVGVYNPSFNMTMATKYTSPVVDYLKCERLVMNMVSQLERPPTLKGTELYITSAFFHRLSEGNAVTYNKVFHNGGRTNINEIIYRAKIKCQETRKDEPFLCLDMIYMYVLLRDVFGYSQGDTIYTYEELYGKKINYGLGAAFLNLQTQILPREKYNNTITDDW